MADKESAEDKKEGTELQTTAPEGNLLDQIITEGKMARDQLQTTYAKDLVQEFVGQILDDQMTVSTDTVAMINQRIAKIDELIGGQLNAIMHEPEFISQVFANSRRTRHHGTSPSHR